MKTSLILRTLSQCARFQRHRTLPQLYCCSYQSPCPQKKNYISLKHYSTKPLQEMEEIYAGPAAQHIFYVKILSLTTSVIALGIQTAVVMRMSLDTFKLIACSFLCVFTFATPILMHLVFRRYVIKLYFDKENDTYTALLYNLYGAKKEVTFTPADAQTLKIEFMSTVKVKGYPLFFDPNHFTDLMHYKRILGYDKPIDMNQGMLPLDEELKLLRTQRESNLRDKSVDEKAVDAEDAEKRTSQRQ